MMLLVAMCVAVADITLLGHTGAINTMNGIKIVGETAYLAAGRSGLVKVNVSSLDQPYVSARVHYSNQPFTQAVDVVGTTAFLADSHGLFVVSGTTVVGHLDMPSRNVRAPASVNIVYVRTFRTSAVNAVLAVDTTDPTNPTVLAAYDLTGDGDEDVFDAEGTTVYAFNKTHLEIIGFGNPASPVLLGAMDFTFTGVATNDIQVTDMQVSGGRIYVAAADYGLVIVDIATPSAPAQVGRYPHSALSVFVDGTTAYITDRNRKFSILDVTHPQALLELSERPTSTAAIPRRVVVSENTAYIVAANDIEFFDVRTPSNPSVLGMYDPPGGDTADVAVSGNFAYVSDEDNVLQVVDISDPTNLTVVSTYEGGGVTAVAVSAVQVTGTTVYILGCSDFVLSVFDVSDPKKVQLIGTYPYSSKKVCPSSMKVVGTVAYVASYVDGLLMFDVTLPSHITPLGNYSIDTAHDVFVSGSTAHVTDARGNLFLINVGNPCAPTLIGSGATPGESPVVFVNDIAAYIADSKGLHVVDVSSPSTPTLVGSVLISGSSFQNNIGMAGDLVVVSTRPQFSSNMEGIQLVDVSTPSAPTLGESYTRRWGRGFSVVDNLLYLAGEGLDALRLWDFTAEPTTAPDTIAPTASPTLSPPTDAPATRAPNTPEPTSAPTTTAPTDIPATLAPNTSAPQTGIPTMNPSTQAPNTTAPATPAPATPAPATPAPATPAPATPAPATPAPATPAPATPAPATPAPATPAPASLMPAPNTLAPLTDAPATPAGSGPKAALIVIAVVGYVVVVVVLVGGYFWYKGNKKRARLTTFNNTSEMHPTGPLSV
eukprot:TRINITY_DN521_c0_g1_i2.p1 TRINITY_DN521_c0_g1~~TRINITY_DN521_c0_g1_i2.p1  ORF type:complete len:862 (+),score=192.75 TRINITY_DN521_c0_g1_i2:113-2587(+)